jgi:hypothetical protein
LFKVSLQKETLNVFELKKKFFEFFVIVVFNRTNFVSHGGELVDLGFDFVMELSNFVFQVIHLEFVKHHHVMVPVLTKETLEANRT